MASLNWTLRLELGVILQAGSGDPLSTSVHQHQRDRGNEGDADRFAQHHVPGGDAEQRC